TPELNNADQIERYLHEDDLHAWGFVIYRCTYQSNTAWDEFMCRLLTNTKDTLEDEGGLDLLNNLALTVIEDPGKLDGATTAVIRPHFKQWVVTPQCNKNRVLAQGCCGRNDTNYAACLRLCSHRREGGGFVRLIRRDWEEYDPYDEGERVEEEQEAIERFTLEDVGWIKVPFDGVIVVPWYYLRGEGWETEYRRPPKIACF
ncbi:uncharacterized protein N7458_006312, partial [Penicillium daleae]